MAAKVVPITKSAKADGEGNKARARAEPPHTPAGWDPYEVWRTRVLKPRLEERERKASAPVSRFWRPVLAMLRLKRKD